MKEQLNSAILIIIIIIIIIIINYYSRLSLNGHLTKTDTQCRFQRCPSQRELTVFDFFKNFSNETSTTSSHRLKFLEPHCKKDVFKFPFSQKLLENVISSSLICLILPLLPNLRITLVHLLNKNMYISTVNFLFYIILIVACNFFFYIL